MRAASGDEQQTHDAGAPAPASGAAPDDGG